jgi:Carboxypeptidase regulatory-like domain
LAEEAWMMRGFLIGSVLALLISMMASTAIAQASTGRISGRVVDQTGAPLPGVTITGKTKDQPRQAISDGHGTFALKDLRPDSYALTATLLGFRAERRRIQVRAGEASSVGITMRVCRAEGLTLAFARKIEVLLNPDPTVETGKEYVIWLTWRSDKRAFDSGSDVEGVVRRVEHGQVDLQLGLCVDTQNGPPCKRLYTVDEFLAVARRAFKR